MTARVDPMSPPRVARQILVAGLLACGLAVTTVSPAAACLFGPATLNDLAATTEFIFVAEVVSDDERTYVLDVSRVFRGDVPPSVTFAPRSDDVVSSCDATLDLGATYLFGMNDLAGVLGIGEVWLEINGERLSGIRIETPDGGTSALYDMLDQLPDTAPAVPRSPNHLPTARTTAGVVLLIVATALVVMQVRHHPTPTLEP